VETGSPGCGAQRHRALRAPGTQPVRDSCERRGQPSSQRRKTRTSPSELLSPTLLFFWFFPARNSAARSPKDTPNTSAYPGTTLALAPTASRRGCLLPGKETTLTEHGTDPRFPTQSQQQQNCLPAAPVSQLRPAPPQSPRPPVLSARAHPANPRFCGDRVPAAGTATEGFPLLGGINQLA